MSIIQAAPKNKRKRNEVEGLPLDFFDSASTKPSLKSAANQKQKNQIDELYKEFKKDLVDDLSQGEIAKEQPLEAVEAVEAVAVEAVAVEAVDFSETLFEQDEEEVQEHIRYAERLDDLIDSRTLLKVKTKKQTNSTLPMIIASDSEGSEGSDFEWNSKQI